MELSKSSNRNLTMYQTFFLFFFIPLINSNVVSAQWWTPSNLPHSGWVYSFLEIPNSNSETILYAGKDDGIWLSFDKGYNWLFTGVPVTCTCFAVSGNKVFAGTYDGVYMLNNDHRGWTAVNNGLTNIFVSSLAVIPGDSGKTSIFAGTDDGIFLSDNDGADWTAVNNGLGDTDIHALGAVLGDSGKTRLYAGTRGGDIFRSDNKGLNWTKANNEFNNSGGLRCFTKIPQDSGGTRYLAVTTSGLFISNDNNTTWNNIPTQFSNNSITSLTTYKNKSGRINIVAGTNERGVYYTSDGGQTWITLPELSYWNLRTSNTVLSLAVSGTNLFAGTMGYGALMFSLPSTELFPEKKKNFFHLTTGLSYKYSYYKEEYSRMYNNISENIDSGWVKYTIIDSTMDSSFTKWNIKADCNVFMHTSKQSSGVTYIDTSYWRTNEEYFTLKENNLEEHLVSCTSTFGIWDSPFILSISSPYGPENITYYIPRYKEETFPYDSLEIGSSETDLKRVVTLKNGIGLTKLLEYSSSFGYYYSSSQKKTAELIEYKETSSEIINLVERHFHLFQNYPNPFNPSTNICYSIATESNVLIKVYDLLGREISILENDYKPAGTYIINFNASSLPSGVYFLILNSGGRTETRKILLQR